jgi:hypothetical protein
MEVTFVEDEWCIHYNDCPVIKAYEKGIIDVDWLDIYCRSNWQECARIQLEESQDYGLELLLPDGSLRKDSNILK